MQLFILNYGGGAIALFFMILATLIPSRAIRFACSFLAILALLAHAAPVLALIAIGGSGDSGDKMVSDLFGRLIAFGVLTLIWATALLSPPAGKSAQPPEPITASDRDTTSEPSQRNPQPGND